MARGKPARLTPAQEREIAAKYDSSFDVTIASLSKEYEAGRETIRNAIIKHGGTIRPKGGLGKGRYSHLKGYKWINPGGYVVINLGGKHNTILEHRLVMSEAIGRPLHKHETVHHINGDRSDNRLENLELWSTSQPAGQRVDDKVTWAEEILRTYAPWLLAEEAVANA